MSKLEERNRIIVSEYLNGNSSCEKLAQRFGLTRQRIHQIVRRDGRSYMESYRHARVKVKNMQRKIKVAERMMACDVRAWGCDRKTAIALNGGLPLNTPRSLAAAYRSKKANVRRIGKTWSVTFPEWVALWGGRRPAGRAPSAPAVILRPGKRTYTADNIYIGTIRVARGQRHSGYRSR